MINSIEIENFRNKILLAICGDRVTPCPLNINIKLK